MNTPQGHRLVQFELLRILAMLFIVLNHVIGYGLGIFESFTVDTSTMMGFLLWSVLQIMKLIPLTGVNLFVLITGYFMIDRQQLRFKGIWRVWSTAWLYAVGIYLLASAIGVVPFNWHELMKEATPLLSNSYWFVTSYIILMVLSPLLSMVLDKVTKTQYGIILLLGGIVCFQPLLGQFVMDGQQILLFMYLFAIGGYIRKYYEAQTTNRISPTLVSGVILLLMFLFALYKNIVLGSSDYKIVSMTYYGLTLPLSVSVFLDAKNWHIQSDKTRRIILMIAPLSFSVYLIDSQSVVHVLLYNNLQSLLLSINPYLLPIACIVFTLIIYTVCISIDYIRFRLARFFVKEP